MTVVLTIEELLENPYPRITLVRGRFRLLRSPHESLQIESPVIPLFVAETLEALPDADSRIDFLLALIRLTGVPDPKLYALIEEMRPAA